MSLRGAVHVSYRTIVLSSFGKKLRTSHSHNMYPFLAASFTKHGFLALTMFVCFQYQFVADYTICFAVLASFSLLLGVTLRSSFRSDMIPSAWQSRMLYSTPVVSTLTCKITRQMHTCGGGWGYNLSLWGDLLSLYNCASLQVFVCTKTFQTTKWVDTHLQALGHMRPQGWLSKISVGGKSSYNYK